MKNLLSTIVYSVLERHEEISSGRLEKGMNQTMDAWNASKEELKVDKVIP